jgi:drug/metabolite transporter (DMT)-like permease
VAAILGILGLHEVFTPSMGIGFALVILGSTLATRRPGTVEAQGATAMEADLQPAAK